jgi:uncharacterized protein YjiS (DUF1127 family)
MPISPIHAVPARAGRFAAAVAWCSDVLRNWRLQRRVRLTAQALAHLDDRTLHDIGFDRSDIAAVSAELHRQCQPTFARTALAIRRG